MPSHPSTQQLREGPPISERSEVTLEQAYTHCRELVRTHYENFPVGSILTPLRLRRFVHAIYAFARRADDFADEGNIPAGERLRMLDDWANRLDECFGGTPQGPVFVALADAVSNCGLLKSDLEDLLDAFRMDVTITGFSTHESLLQYCSKSANPVGRLVLTVYRCASPETVQLSDALCTALQLVNFWQDISIDNRKGRMYLPLEDVEQFGYTRNELQEGVVNDAFRRVMDLQIRRARELFRLSAPLPALVPYRLGVELSLTWNGGMTILRKIEDSGYDVFGNRPVVTTGDKLRILISSLFRKTA